MELFTTEEKTRSTMRRLLLIYLVPSVIFFLTLFVNPEYFFITDKNFWGFLIYLFMFVSILFLAIFIYSFLKRKHNKQISNIIIKYSVIPNLITIVIVITVIRDIIDYN